MNKLEGKLKEIEKAENVIANEKSEYFENICDFVFLEARNESFLSRNTTETLNIIFAFYFFMKGDDVEKHIGLLGNLYNLHLSCHVTDKSGFGLLDEKAISTESVMINIVKKRVWLKDYPYIDLISKEKVDLSEVESVNEAVSSLSKKYFEGVVKSEDGGFIVPQNSECGQLKVSKCCISKLLELMDEKIVFCNSNEFKGLVFNLGDKVVGSEFSNVLNEKEKIILREKLKRNCQSNSKIKQKIKL